MKMVGYWNSISKESYNIDINTNRICSDLFSWPSGQAWKRLPSSLGKKNVQSGKFGTYGLMLLNVSVAIVIFACTALFWPSTFVFSPSSLPFFLTRACFEIAQIYFSTKAVVLADRTTFSFVRTLTIPLLLLVDIIVGYPISAIQIVGIFFLVAVILSIFIGKKFSNRAIGFVMLSAVNAVITISLFKYDITHFNSIVAEQMGILSIIFLYAAMSRYIYAEPEPFRLIRSDTSVFVQVLSNGISNVCQSLAFYYIPPSILTAVKRSTGVFWSLLSGRFAFQEKHFLWKSAIMIGLILSLLLLMQGA